MTEDDIEEYLDERKGQYTFIVLSLRYPHLRFDQVQFHQDHIHPYSRFTLSRLGRLGLDQDTVRKWQEDRDRLPNLQWMEGAENKTKHDAPFDQWLAGLDGARDHFEVANLIPPHVSPRMEDF